VIPPINDSSLMIFGFHDHDDEGEQDAGMGHPPIPVFQAYAAQVASHGTS